MHEINCPICFKCDEYMIWDYKAQYWICRICGSYIDDKTFVSKDGYFEGHTKILGMIRNG